MAARLVPVARLAGGVLMRILDAAGVGTAGTAELPVDRGDHRAADGQVGDRRDDGAGADQQQQDTGDQPRAERTPRQPSRPAVGAARTGHQPAGFRTYPTPRTVWMSGTRPASIFLRR